MVKQKLSELIAFHLQHKTISGVVWTATFLFSTAWLSLVTDIPGHTDLTVLICISAPLLGLFPLFLLSEYSIALEKRITASDGGPTWDVLVNSIHVGIIKDAEYAAIRQSVFLAPDTAVAQLLSTLGTALRVVTSFLGIFPSVMFWGAVIIFLVDPTAFSEFVGTVQRATHDQLIGSFTMLVKTLLTSFIIFLGGLAFLGRTFGFANIYSRACAEAIRQQVSCPADGEVTLLRIEGNEIILPNELASLKER